jgi:serine phosphatase RsbU (regulator of sigma subunit)
VDERRVRILLVEDDPDDVWLIRNLLGDRWDGPFELLHVELLSAAIDLCAQGGIDVLLLDLSLPDSRGLETFLRAYAKAGNVPIVVLTGLNDEQIAIKAVQAGAQDYLVKGQVDDHVLMRAIRYAIERNRRDLAEQALRATSEEFRVAQQIQKRLFPTQSPNLEGFDIAGAVYPAKATAGDYFDYIPMQHETVGIVVGDVSSHGMGPALVMAETRACLRALAQAYGDVGEILTRANRVLSQDVEDIHFVTLALARIDPKRRRMIYASAGQRGYLIEPSGEIRVLDSTSQPLGIAPDLIVPSAPQLKLAPGQIVVFFTDGVVETESPGKARFGTQRALKHIQSEQQRPASDIVQSLYQALVDFRNFRPQLDDITAVIIKVLPK